MPKLLHSVSVQDQAITADGIYNFDLAVNPLSVVLVILRPLNDTGTLSNFNNYLAILQAINRLSIYHRGAVVKSMRGEDAGALNYFRHGIMPMQANNNDTDNERRAVVLPILMGRFAYDPSSCFPSSRRGELILELDLDIADTGYDGLRLSVETIELLDAKPKEYERVTSLAQTFAATGDNDVDLAPGNVNRGILVWGTTGFTGASPAPSWGRLKLLLDNVETVYAATDFEVSQTIGQLWGRQLPAADGHKHRTTTDGNAQTLVTTVAGPFQQSMGWQNYAYLELDPTGDDTYSIDTRGFSRFHLRPNVETADAVRALQIEVIKAS